MGQLVIVVMAIVLTAIVVAGGVNYMSPDAGVRSQTAERVVSSYRMAESAFASYRVANRGALPTPAKSDTHKEDQAWRHELVSYLPSGGLFVPEAMEWNYLRPAINERVFCLSQNPGSDLPDAVRDGIISLDGKITDAMIVPMCADPSAQWRIEFPYDMPLVIKEIEFYSWPSKSKLEVHSSSHPELVDGDKNTFFATDHADLEPLLFTFTDNAEDPLVTVRMVKIFADMAVFPPFEVHSGNSASPSWSIDAATSVDYVRDFSFQPTPDDQISLVVNMTR